MILQQDIESGLMDWIFNIKIKRAGSFLRAIAEAAYRADAENYPILRPALMALMAKYPEYQNMDARPGEKRPLEESDPL